MNFLAWYNIFLIVNMPVDIASLPIRVCQYSDSVQADSTLHHGSYLKMLPDGRIASVDINRLSGQNRFDTISQIITLNPNHTYASSSTDVSGNPLKGGQVYRYEDGNQILLSKLVQYENDSALDSIVFFYDQGRLLNSINPTPYDTTYTTYAYDEQGRVILKTDSNAYDIIRHTFSYDKPDTIREDVSNGQGFPSGYWNEWILYAGRLIGMNERRGDAITGVTTYEYLGLAAVRNPFAPNPAAHFPVFTNGTAGTVDALGRTGETFRRHPFPVAWRTR